MGTASLVSMWSTLDLNREALTQMRCETGLEIVTDAIHLSEEPDALDQVAAVARQWFARHFQEVDTGRFRA